VKTLEKTKENMWDIRFFLHESPGKKTRSRVDFVARKGELMQEGALTSYALILPISQLRHSRRAIIRTSITRHV